MTTFINASTSSGLVQTADTSGSLALQTASTTAVTIDASQNLGLGVTPSAWSGYKVFEFTIGGVLWSPGAAASRLGSNYYYNGTNFIYKASNNATDYRQNTGAHEWHTAPSGTAGNAITFTQAMTLDASGNLGIGTSSPSSKLDVSGVVSLQGTTLPSAGTARLYSRSSDSSFYMQSATGGSINLLDGSQNSMALFGSSLVQFLTGNTERMRITSGGYLKASNTGTYQTPAGPFHEFYNTAADNTAKFGNSNAVNPYGPDIAYLAAAPNGTSNNFLYCSDTGGLRMSVRSNGGIANYSANNVNLSDRREKTNFAPAKSYLNTICSIPVQTFNYIDQNLEQDDGLTLGVVAQDVQEVAPELVQETNWAHKDEEPKIRLSIYQTDLQYALMKSIQELKALNDTQAETINALTARIVALEGR